MQRQVYLGDGLYLTTEDHPDAVHPVILTTGHHDIEKADNVVYMEGAVLHAFVEAIEELRRAAN